MKPTTHQLSLRFTFDVVIEYQKGEPDVGIAEGYFFDIDGIDCSNTGCYETREEALDEAQEFLDNLELEQ